MSFTRFKLKSAHENSDSDLDLSREDDATTQCSNEHTNQSANDPNGDSFPESLYEHIEEFLDNEDITFMKYSPVLRSKLIKPLAILGRVCLSEEKPRNHSALLAETESQDCEAPLLIRFAERRRKTMLSLIQPQ